QLDELRFAACRGSAALESEPHGNADIRESAGDQRHRRGWNHRLYASHCERGGGCAGSPWRHANRHGAQAAKNLALVSRKKASEIRSAQMIPVSFDYIAPQSLDEALRALAAH